MISTHPRRDTVLADGVDEEVEDGAGAVIRMDANASDEAREAVDEAMDDKFPSYEPWGVRQFHDEQVDRLQIGSKGDTHRVGHHDG